VVATTNQGNYNEIQKHEEPHDVLSGRKREVLCMKTAKQ